MCLRYARQYHRGCFRLGNHHDHDSVQDDDYDGPTYHDHHASAYDDYN